MAKKLDIESIINKYSNIEFTQQLTHCETGDCVEFYIEDADFHAERIDCWLTIYRAFDDGRLTGFMLKNVNTLATKFDGFNFGYACKPGGGWEFNIQVAIASLPTIEPDTTGDKRAYTDLTRALYGLQDSLKLPAG